LELPLVRTLGQNESADFRRNPTLLFEVFLISKPGDETGIHVDGSVGRDHRPTLAGTSDKRRRPRLRPPETPYFHVVRSEAKHPGGRSKPPVSKQSPRTDRRPAKFSARTCVMKKTESRRPAKARLLCYLDRLWGYCQPLPNQKAHDATNSEEPLWERHVRWPGREFLRDVERNVLVLALYERARQILPTWKAFKIVDKRMPTLRLVQRVDNLAKRATERLKEAGESELSKMVREAEVGSTEAQCSLRDRLLQEKDFTELLLQDRRCVRQRVEAWPLVEWLIEIGHPMVRDFDDGTRFIDDGFQQAMEELKVSRQRAKQRERVRRHRLSKRISSKSVTRT
jgi:hypothetical protein